LEFNQVWGILEGSQGDATEPFAEAKFSLVMCSATVNFLKEKYGK
jgi:hypothetical protein